jgi:predicted dinucleotide-binding enzyme
MSAITSATPAPPSPNGQRAFFLAGDDADARAQVAGLMKQQDLASIDLGALESGGRLFELPCVRSP